MGSGSNGAIVQNTPSTHREVNFASITDGTANTILIGEKHLDIGHIGQYQSDDNEGYTAGWDWDTVRHSNLIPQKDTPNSGASDHFGSSHPSGCMFVFCDGSVRSIPYGINATTFARLGYRNDGAVIGNY
jgi:prepilin-type processing-associated H-X9-DG protein